ncbi:hypothetical protein V8E55_000866 [Tylopilus felleus]
MQAFSLFTLLHFFSAVASSNRLLDLAADDSEHPWQHFSQTPIIQPNGRCSYSPSRPHPLTNHFSEDFVICAGSVLFRATPDKRE